MFKNHLFTFTCIFVLSFLIFKNSYSQNKISYNLFTLRDNSSLLNSTELRNVISNAVILNINNDELQSLYDNKFPEISLSIPYNQTDIARLNLKRFDVLSPDAKIVARTAIGNEEVKINDVAVSYIGEVEGIDDAFVTITFCRDNVTGMLCTKNDNYVLGSLKGRIGNQTESYILYKESDLKIKNNFICGTEDDLSSESIDRMRKVIMENINKSPTDLYVADIAIEMDYVTYTTSGSSVQNASNYALALLSAVSAVYMKEVNTRLLVTYIRVWTVQDPYDGTTSLDLLNQFTAEWNTNMQSVPRAIAHFISLRGNNLGGIAWLDGLCSTVSGGFGYAFSNTYGPILPLPTYSWDVQVVSHEIGHNFGSNHTHNCAWIGGPIDSCYAVEGGCYSGPVRPRLGTIMSYCHLTGGGISLALGFGPQPRALIRDRAENGACLYISQRDLLVAYPNGGEIIRTGSATQIYWGTSLTGNVNIEYSTNNGIDWQTIQNNVPANQRIYDWTIPYISTSLQSKLRIINSSNPSVGDTCDASFRIILNLNAFNIISPPNLTRIEVASNNTGVQKFDWQRTGINQTIRYKLKIRKLATTVDYDYISDNGGADSIASVRKSWLDSLAQTLGVTGDSVRCSWKVWSYNGYDSLVSTNTFIFTLVRITVGINTINIEVPDKFNLENNYPNPFNPTTNIKFDIAKSTFVELKVFDLRGREVSILINQRLQPGSYKYTFNAANLPSGVYFYSIKTNEYNSIKKMILIK